MNLSTCIYLKYLILILYCKGPPSLEKFCMKYMVTKKKGHIVLHEIYGNNIVLYRNE